MPSDAGCPKGVERVKANTGNIESGVPTQNPPACLFAKAAVICVDAAKSGGASLKQAVVVAISAASPMRG